MSDSLAEQGQSNKVLLIVLALLIAGYLALSGVGLPQRATEQILEAEAHGPSVNETRTPPPWAMVLPFAVLLGAIAVLPLAHATSHWWEHNRNKFLVAGGLGLVTLAYYLAFHPYPIDRHFLGHAQIEPTSGGISWQLPWTVIQNAMFNDFVPFIILLFSLYTISGGIRIQGDLPAHPFTNTCFLAMGAVLASLIGTTGAAMLLIRPLLETNSERRHVKHTVVFFIFLTCNCGGCLLPIGDPPLFLGYLKGVDFLWTLSLWKEWLTVNGLLLVIYYLWDHFWCYPHEQKVDLLVDELRTRSLQVLGAWPNVLLLLGIVLAAALLSPTKPFPGTDWHPWFYLREIVQLGLVGLSLILGSDRVREANKFNFGAIVEVAALFVGIFICMQPALQILDVQKGGQLGLDSPTKFFWYTGALSSILDNAPTYLVFFEAAKAQNITAGATMPHIAVPDVTLAAISLGAVFMGANTYIGNGPNFMVKTIAENSGIKMPSFFGYMLYSGCILIPLFILTTILYF